MTDRKLQSSLEKPSRKTNGVNESTVSPASTTGANDSPTARSDTPTPDQPLDAPTSSAHRYRNPSSTSSETDVPGAGVSSARFSPPIDAEFAGGGSRHWSTVRGPRHERGRRSRCPAQQSDRPRR